MTPPLQGLLDLLWAVSEAPGRRWLHPWRDQDGSTSWGGPQVTKELRWKQGHVGDVPVAMTHGPGEMPRLRTQRELVPQTHHWSQVFCMQNTLQKVCDNGLYLFWSSHKNSFCGLLFWVVMEIYWGFPTYWHEASYDQMTTAYPISFYTIYILVPCAFSDLRTNKNNLTHNKTTKGDRGDTNRKRISQTLTVWCW